MTKKKPVPSEKREAYRVNIPIKISYRPRGEKKWQKAIASNISGKGVYLITKRPLEAGRAIDISFRPEGSKVKPFRMLCEPVWVKQLKKNEFRCGLKFNEIHTLDDFMHFICDKVLDLHLFT